MATARAAVVYFSLSIDGSFVQVHKMYLDCCAEGPSEFCCCISRRGSSVPTLPAAGAQSSAMDPTLTVHRFAIVVELLDFHDPRRSALRSFDCSYYDLEQSS